VGFVMFFMVSEPLAGKRYMKVTQSRTKKDWALLVQYICDKLYPKAKIITLVMDNLASHSAAALYETFAPAEAKRLWDRLEFVFTPKHGSWLNIAEIEISALNRCCLKERVATVEEFETETEAYTGKKNAKATPIDWQFTNADARVKLLSLYPSF